MIKNRRSAALLLILFLNLCCSKSDQDHIADCLGDSTFTQLRHNADAVDPSRVDFSITYTGSRTLSSVKWDFGDGQTGQGASVSHLYSRGGTYEVKADVQTTDASSYKCGHGIKKSITVN